MFPKAEYGATSVVKVHMYRAVKSVGKQSVNTLMMNKFLGSLGHYRIRSESPGCRCCCRKRHRSQQSERTSTASHHGSCTSTCRRIACDSTARQTISISAAIFMPPMICCVKMIEGTSPARRDEAGADPRNTSVLIRAAVCCRHGGRHQ